jgi:hypothetical protein
VSVSTGTLVAGEISVNTISSAMVRSDAVSSVSVSTGTLLAGEISVNTNLELLAEITPAIMTYRIFMSQQPVNRKFIEALVDDVLIPSALKN